MKRPRFKKLLIIGVGLLGGSIGLAARKRRLAEEVWGYGRKLSRVKAARRKGLLTHASSDLEEACSGADFIVLCTPFTLFESVLKKIAKFAPEACLVTDVGSVKGAWVSRWERAAKPLRFVPAHPMAGSENTGWEHGRADLFEGAPCILTPTASTSKVALSQVQAFWTALGCRIYRRTSLEHDRLIGRFSHLTHALAFALSKSAARGLKRSDFDLAGPSFWGNTRISASDPGLWTDIFEYNRPVLIEEIDTVIAELRKLRELRGSALYKELEQISLRARRIRP
jgi:prephenate dehydrogenase